MTFNEFLAYFPEVDVPFTITEYSIDAFRQTNDYLPQIAVDTIIVEWEGEDEDDLTEYYPCLRLPQTENYDCILYWKAGLLKYEYKLVTFNRKNDIIAQRVIAGMVVKGEDIIKSVARLDEERIIHIVTVAHNANTDEFDPATTLPYTMEIMDTGDIVSS